MRCRLQAIAQLGVLNLRQLTAGELPALLPALLPAAWRGAKAAPWTPGADGHPTEQWLARLWAKLQVHPKHAQLQANLHVTLGSERLRVSASGCSR